MSLGLLLFVGIILFRLWPFLVGEELPLLFVHLTLPRLAIACVAGAALGIAGALLQGLTRNPLASPSILGITAGAHLALVLALTLTDGAFPVIVAAFLGALAAAQLTWLLAGPAGRSGATLALAGVAVNLCLSALAAALTLLNEQQMAGAFLWSAGAPVEVGWHPVLSLTPWAVIGIVAALPLVRGLDALALGDAMARSLGISPLRLTVAGLVTAGLAAGAAVALTGPVAFIGLLAPNALRRLGVQRHAWLLPLSALWGAVLLSFADGIADGLGRLGREVPVGVVTSLIGAPVLLWLVALVRKQTGAAEPFSATAMRRGIGAYLLALGLLGVLGVASILLGNPNLGLRTLADMMQDRVSASTAFLILDLRLPRFLVAAGAGLLLALAGQLLQAALRNPLAGPETLGLSQGAALFALFALIAGAVPGGLAMQASAMGGALIALGVVALVGWRTQFAAVPMVLAGIALAALMASASALAILLAELQAAQALTWLTGSVYARGWSNWSSLWPLMLVIIGLAAWLGPRLDLLGLGDLKVSTLGARPGLLRMTAAALAAAAAAIAVSAVGSVAFVGLLGPHLARLFFGGSFRVRLPLVLAVGAILTATADLAGRLLLAPVQLPVGVMTALVGAPYFLWLLRRTRTEPVL